MTKKYKVLQCPNCTESIYFPIDEYRVSCHLCGFRILLPIQKGTCVPSIQEAPLVAQEHHSSNQVSVHRCVNLRTAEQVLKILRSHQIDTLKWLSLNEVFRQCLEAGFFPFEIRKALDILKAEGFVEKRGDTIRVVPLN